MLQSWLLLVYIIRSLVKSFFKGWSICNLNTENFFAIISRYIVMKLFRIENRYWKNFGATGSAFKTKASGKPRSGRSRKTLWMMEKFYKSSTTVYERTESTILTMSIFRAICLNNSKIFFWILFTLSFCPPWKHGRYFCRTSYLNYFGL